MPGLTLLENENMSRHSSFKIGGPVRAVAIPSDVSSLSKICHFLKENHTAPYILGNGTNILFPDEGMKDLFIISTEKLTKLFLLDYGVNVRKTPEVCCDYFPQHSVPGEAGYIIPFGDGPAPVYSHQVGKRVIQNMLNQAEHYMYMMSPYLIIDSELCCAIEYAAMRGVDVRIIVPHIPDKRLVFEMTQCYYERLMKTGVRIYEYEPGFIHAKCYLADGKYAMIGTINLDYRSLAHHFENGVWMYRCACIEDIKADFTDTFGKSIMIEEHMLKKGLIHRLLRSLVKIFAPML